MPRKKSSFAASVGSRGEKAFETHKGDATDFGGAEVPAGITGGVAQLYECKFDTFNKGENAGEYYFFASGVIHEPVSHDGVHCKGRHTRIGPEAICDTPNRSRETIEEHIDWVCNELRKLGGDDLLEGAELAELETIVEQLKEERPFFKFRTWQGEATKQYPNPRVNHIWQGACEYDGSEDEAEAVEDATDDDGEEGEPDDNLVQLGKDADNDGEEAQAELEKLAEEAGVDPEEYETWAELVEAIVEAQGGAEEEEEDEMEGDEEEEDAEEDEEEEEEEEVVEPSKEEVYYYKPPKARKRVECEVTAVFPGKETCNLKSLDDGKVFKAVPWSKLEEE